jgi:type IV secretion system protein VirB6
VIALTAIYAMFLLALSRIALSVLLALGPLFFALLLFDSTRRFFESWLAQLCNYAFITILTVLVAALMLYVVGRAAQNAVALGGGIQIADGARVCIAAGLTFLVMRQVMPMAASLASGLALSTFGVTSAAVGWALGSAYRKGTRSAGDFGRGLTDSTTSRWDSWSRKAGYYTGRGVSRLVTRPNQIRARS